MSFIEQIIFLLLLRKLRNCTQILKLQDVNNDRYIQFRCKY